MDNNFNKVLDYLSNNKVDKIIFHRHILLFYKDNKETQIITTGWSNEECLILIQQLNKLYNNLESSNATDHQTINNKLKELNIPLTR